MEREQLLFVDAWVFGLGWLCFGYGSLAEIERLEAAAGQTATADPHPAGGIEDRERAAEKAGMSKKLHPWSMGNSNRSRFRKVGEARTEPDPEPHEIAALCREIQADWSEKERQASRLWMPVGGTLVKPNMDNLPEYEIPTICTAEVRCA